MKKQSRPLGAIPYGCGPVLHGICEVDPTKSLRECVGDLPLYAVMNFLMRITVKLEEPITGAVSTEEHACYQEPLPKAMCITPLSLRADMTPPGTDFANQGAAINGSLPMPPRLAGSDAPAATTVIEARDASSDDSSSVLENRDCLFMLSLRPKKIHASGLHVREESMMHGYFHYYHRNLLLPIGFLHYRSLFYGNLW